MARLLVNHRKLRENYGRAAEFCLGIGVAMLPVTKLVLSRPSILAGLPGLKRVADVHPSNLLRAREELGVLTELMRVRRCDLPDIRASCDAVFVSDPAMVRALSAALERDELAAPGQGILPPLPVMLHLEYGDLRDGVPVDHAADVLRGIASTPGLLAEGVSINLGCLDGALPDSGTLERIALDMRRLRRDSGQKLPRCSIGGSLFLSWLEGVRMPEEINELRLGESWFCATCATTGERYASFHDDVFVLELEVLESWTKNVSGNGQGRNAQGGRTNEPFRGRRRRAVLEGGENVAPCADLKPLLPGAVVVGATHEHLVVDVTAMDKPPGCGDTLLFRPGYEAVTQAIMSPFVEICICKD